MGINSKVICHSKAPNGEELITLEIDFHRFILPELNTHRKFSRNYQSSRAVPIQSMIDQVRNDPAIPVHFGKNQSGMVADYENDKPIAVDDQYYLVKEFWELAALSAASMAEQLKQADYHKQVVNRLLEPFMWTKGIITATREAYDAFFVLRCHKDAQPEIKALAEAMRGSIESSKPLDLNYGEYHLPYVETFLDSSTGNRVPCIKKEGNSFLTSLNIVGAIRVSTSCNAQVSYRKLDDSLEKANKVYNMLNLPVNGEYPEDPPHFSPTEHIAMVVQEGSTWGKRRSSGNFNSNTFWQYRKALEVGLEGEFYNEFN